jgi:hypothetical protein
VLSDLRLPRPYGGIWKYRHRTALHHRTALEDGQAECACSGIEGGGIEAIGSQRFQAIGPAINLTPVRPR